jgi:CRP-like cAMP-binding protein
VKKDKASAGAFPDCRECRFGRSGVYRDVLRAGTERISSSRSGVVRQGPSRVLIRQDHTPSAIYLVRKGWLYRYRNLGNGRQQIISFIIPGDIITFSTIFNPDSPLCYGVKSATKIELCSFDSAGFRRGIAADPVFIGPYRGALSAYLDSLHRRIADIGQRTARGRMAQLLVELFDRHQAHGLVIGNGFEFPVTQELLARALGLTKAYVNRTLGSLKDAGIIRLHERQLSVLELQRLRDIAETE